MESDQDVGKVTGSIDASDEQRSKQDDSDRCFATNAQNNLEEETFTCQNFKDTFSSLNSQRLSSTKYCDAVLVVEGRKFSVHKAVLGSISDYFDKLFTSDMQETHQDLINITGVTADILDIILTLIYTSEIRINNNNVYDILSAGNYLTLASAKECCAKYLMKHQTVRDCLKIWKASRQFFVESLEEGSGNFIAQNYDEVCKEESFLKLNVEELSNIIELKKDKRNSEESAFRAILAWVEHDLGSREKNLNDLFEKLNFDYFSKQYLAEAVANENLIKQSLQRSNAILQALSRKVTEEMSNQNLPIRSQSFLFFNQDFTTITLFDLETQAQQQLSKGMEPREGSSAIVLGNFIYLIGGKIAGKLTSSVMKLNLDRPATGWTDVASLNNPRSHAKVATFDGRIYVIGGMHQKSNDVSEEKMRAGEIYWPDEDKWYLSTVAPMHLTITAVVSDETAAQTRVITHQAETQPVQDCSLCVFGYNDNDQFPTFPKYSKLENGNWTETQRGGFNIYDEIALNVRGTIYTFAKVSQTIFSLQKSVGDRFEPVINLDGDERVLDACVVQNRIIALVQQDESSSRTNHCLKVFDTEIRTWRVLRMIDIREFAKLATISN